MKTKKDINQQVDDTFKSLEAIKKVEVNHFFKHKVLQKIQAEKDVKQPVFSWFTPQLQLATLSVVLLLNIGTIFYAFNNSSQSTSSTSDIKTFAQEYSLQSDSSSILN